MKKTQVSLHQHPQLEILIEGSTTVQPVSELLAEAYMDDHQGIKMTEATNVKIDLEVHDDTGMVSKLSQRGGNITIA